MLNKLKSISKLQIIGLALIIIGAFVAYNYASHTFEAYRAIQYARENNFGAGNVDPELIRPWMNIRYIAVAYAVPQEYLFSKLGIEMDRRNSEASLFELNTDYFGREDINNERGRPIIMQKLQDAIQQYRENPVPTGLRENGVRPWMSIQYIANSTGIPADYIFEQIGVPIDGNAYIPIEFLNDDVNFKGGGRAMTEAIQRVVDNYEAEQ